MNPEITEQQKMVLQHLADGLSTEQTARKMFVVADTVKTHLRKFMMKHHLQSRTAAVALALRRGWIE